MIKNKKKTYSIMFGVIFLTLSTLLSMKIISNVWVSEDVNMMILLNLTWPLILINTFVCFNSFLLVNYRLEEYIYEFDFLIAYSAFYFDIFFRFWKDIFDNLRIYKGKKLKFRINKELVNED